MSTQVITPSSQHPTASSLQILRLAQVCRVTGLSRSLVYQMEAEDRFPKRIRLTERAVGWIEDEVQGWLAERVAGSRR
jgi:prophage regulatory protein